ncbi:MAG: FG-GAP repeat domain-containing protein [Gemmatimonadales bacterium]
MVRPFPVVDTAGRALQLAFLGGFNTPRPQLVDADGDRDLDLVVQEQTNRLILLANEGAGPDGMPRFSLRSRAWAGLESGEWSRFVDANADGRPDVFGERPFSYLRYWVNEGGRGREGAGAGEGSTTFALWPDSVRDASGTAIFSDRQNIPQFVDIDCDHRLDLFIGRITGIILRYEADSAIAPGSPAPPVFRLVTDRFEDLEIVTGQGSMHGANTMAFSDVDDDGDLDLVWGDFFEAGLLLFANEGSCAEPRLRRDPVRFPVGDPLVTTGYNAPAFGDLSGDGRRDLVVGVLGGSYDPNRSTIRNLWYYTRDAGGGWRRRTGELLPQIDVGSESVPTLVDLDADGDLDLLLGNKIEPEERGTGRLYWYENVGNRTQPSFRARGGLALRGQYHYAAAAGDLDGDGRADLVVGSFGSRLAFWRNMGGSGRERAGEGASPVLQPADSAVATITRGSHTTPTLGDLDGDGDLDLVVGRASGYLTHFRNDGTRTAPTFVLTADEWAGLRPGRRSAPHLYDLDGDGDLDLLVGTDDKGVTLYRNEGTRSAPRFVPDSAVRLDVPPISAPAAGDLDGDGAAELVVGNAGGGALYFTKSDYSVGLAASVTAASCWKRGLVRSGVQNGSTRSCAAVRR